MYDDILKTAGKQYTIVNRDKMWRFYGTLKILNRSTRPSWLFSFALDLVNIASVSAGTSEMHVSDAQHFGRESTVADFYLFTCPCLVKEAQMII